MIIGATPESDRHIMGLAESLYKKYSLKRVFFSAYLPVNSDSRLPALDVRPPLLREHRLYQADWLMRFYGFTHEEIVVPSASGMLDLEVDPKLAWALAHRQHFPVNLNRAPRMWLLRVPGLGVQSVQRLLAARRVRALRLADLQQLRVATAKVLPFVEIADYRPQPAELDSPHLRPQLLSRMQAGVAQRVHGGMQVPAKTQLALF